MRQFVIELLAYLILDGSCQCSDVVAEMVFSRSYSFCCALAFPSKPDHAADPLAILLRLGKPQSRKTP